MNIVKMSLNVAVIYVFMAIVLGTASLMYFSWIDHYTTIEVREINSSPRQYFGIGDINTSILPAEKLNKKYRYVYVSPLNRLHAQSYLALHPQDAVEKNYRGDGEYSLIIFSDHSPDPKFFKVKK